MKILSVIVPMYNMEKYIEKCLLSLVVPSKFYLEKLEVLVINDGSKDCCSEIAHQFEFQYPYTFRVVDKENGNYGSCINRGLLEARGKYIKILDADDSFDNFSFQDFLARLMECDDDLILTDCCQVNSSGDILLKTNWKNRCEDNKTLDIKSFYVSNIVPEIQMHNVTYKRNILCSINYWQTEGISYTDTEWVIIPLMHIKKIRYYNIPLYKYFIGREGQTVDVQVFKGKFRELSIIANKLIGLYDCSKEESYNLGCFESRLNTFLCHIVYRNSIAGVFSKKETKEFDKQIKKRYPNTYKKMAEWKIDVNGYWFPLKYWRKNILWMFNNYFYHSILNLRVRLGALIRKMNLAPNHIFQ